ncbi:hypothetical protein [Pragia fontium]|uniref:Ppx/GppA phosphatase family protein n=1 Tax=Pragia fontium TaxID=82985 RepID=UPI00064A8FF1|nr:hypothetical protein [Pragia fontium]AKJ41644.1 hypothetical protein QQ39_05720 [Pragia fontium]
MNDSSSIISTSDDAAIQQQFIQLSHSLKHNLPITLLHIGQEKTWVLSGSSQRLSTVQRLNIGAENIAKDCFFHQPPTEGEMERAIMSVEDEVIRISNQVTTDSLLYTTDRTLDDIARAVGITPQPEYRLSLEEVERVFDSLAAVMSGRSAAWEGIPEDNVFSASLLILREFMHHLGFSAITVVEL